MILLKVSKIDYLFKSGLSVLVSIYFPDMDNDIYWDALLCFADLYIGLKSSFYFFVFHFWDAVFSGFYCLVSIAKYDLFWLEVKLV